MEATQHLHVDTAATRAFNALSDLIPTTAEAVAILMAVFWAAQLPPTVGEIHIHSDSMLAQRAAEGRAGWQAPPLPYEIANAVRRAISHARRIRLWHMHCESDGDLILTAIECEAAEEKK